MVQYIGYSAINIKSILSKTYDVKDLKNTLFYFGIEINYDRTRELLTYLKVYI